MAIRVSHSRQPTSHKAIYPRVTLKPELNARGQKSLNAAQAKRAAAKSEALKPAPGARRLSDEQFNQAYQAAFQKADGTSVLKALLKLEGRASPAFQDALQLSIGRLQVLMQDAREGLHRLNSVTPRMSGIALAQTQLLMAKGHRSLGEFREGVSAAKLALQGIQNEVARSGKNDTLTALAGDALFAVGVNLKNLGRIKEATKYMGQASKAHPGNIATRIAYAGYLSMSGRAAESLKVYNAIPPPNRGTTEAVDYATNSAWLMAVSNNKEGFFLWANEIPRRAKASGHVLVGIRRYFETEADFKAFRTDSRFQALLSKLPA